MIRGVADALATYFCSDVADMRDNRYHQGRTGSLQIFVIGNDYYTATKTGKKVVKCRDELYQYDWECISKDFLGWDIYCCECGKGD